MGGGRLLEEKARRRKQGGERLAFHNQDIKAVSIQD